MKNYYFILIENFLGIGYLLLFLFAFFADNPLNIYIGGIGMLVFVFIMIKDESKKLSFFLLICGIGTVIGYFISEWWLGTFWASAFFTAGQIFGIIHLLKNKNQIIDGIENGKIETDDLVKFAMTGKTTDSDKLPQVEILLFIILLIVPYLLSTMVLI